MKQSNIFAIYGDATQDMVSDDVLQTYPDTCAIKSQQLILERFGIHVTEEQLRVEAMERGWYVPGGGTPMDAVGKLLQLHGVEMHQYVDGNICNVLNELALGHQVIMSVDSGELWNYGLRERLEDYLPGVGGADHALIVSGLNTANPNDVKVIVTDPGTGDLCKEYSLAQFVDAANDSNFYMVTTDRAVPHIFDTFGLGVDHLPMVGNMTYDYFLENYALLHDVAGRPVFDDFMNHLNVNVPDMAVGVADIDTHYSNMSEDWDDDDVDDFGELDDIEDFDLDDIDLDF